MVFTLGTEFLLVNLFINFYS